MKHRTGMISDAIAVSYVGEDPTIRIGLYLRDVFATLSKTAITSYTGFEKPDEEDAVDYLDHYNMESGYYVSGTDLYKYIFRYQDSPHMKFRNSDIVTIVIPGLRDRYFEQRDNFVTNAASAISAAVDTKMPTFHNIWDYRKVQKKITPAEDLNAYQLVGTITAYDVVYLSLGDYLDMLNVRSPIVVHLPFMTIDLVSQSSDFYDASVQAVVSDVTL